MGKPMGRWSKAKRLTDQIRHLQKELKEYQSRCKHLRATKTPMSNTGNYDPSADRYWYDCECPTCLTFWTEPQ